MGSSTKSRFRPWLLRLTVYGLLAAALSLLLAALRTSLAENGHSPSMPGDSAMALIPIRVSGERILCELSLPDGRAGQFLLDTCATRCSVEPFWARKHGFQVDMRSSWTETPSGVEHGHRWRSPAFSVGSLFVGPRWMGEYRKDAEDGLLGFDLFRDKCIVFNWEQEQVRCRGECDFEGWVSEQLRLQHGVPMVEVSLPSGRETWFFLDTGCTAPLVIPERLLEDMEAESPPDGPVISATVVGGNAKFARIEARGVELLGLPFEELTTFVQLEVPEGSVLDSMDGIIGLPLVRQRSLAIDAPNRKLWRPRGPLDPPAEP
ncbi:MAG: pepsin/retropepsin-like aspartic protease family protein [Acidobacteriota bacterium]